MKLGRRSRDGSGSPLSKRALLQHVNGEVAALAGGDAAFPLYCECGGEECILTLDVSRDDFESARAHAGSAIVVPEHAGPAERVLARFDGFVVVPAEPLDADRVPDRLQL